MPHVLGRGILGQLVGDAVERVSHLHHAERDVEDLEVVREIPGAPSCLQQPGERRELPGREPDALGVGQLENGARPQAAVEMAVDIDLGQPLDDTRSQSHGKPPL
jgi:hypothetical protein